MDIDEKFNLIKRNTAEIVTEKELKDLLKKKKKPVMYIGISITGRPHIGYFMFVTKLADLLKAGFHVKIMLADFHGALDGTSWDILEKRYKYYERLIPLMFKSYGVDLKHLEFVKGSSFELNKDYWYDVLRVSTFVTINDCKRAAAEVVKFGDNPKLSGLIYPIMQMLDEEYLKVDMQAGGLDQRKIFMFARENHPKIGYKPRVEFMMPMIPSLIGKKMSSSDARGKIDLLDDEKTVLTKVKSAECVAGNPDNGVMAFLKYIIMTIKEDKKEKFVVERDKKYGGNLEYEDYKQIEKDFVAKKLHPLDLKIAAVREINNLLKPMRENKKLLQKLVKEGY